MSGSRPRNLVHFACYADNQSSRNNHQEQSRSKELVDIRCIRCIANLQGLSKKEVEELREAFNLFDTDGTGMIHPQVATEDS